MSTEKDVEAAPPHLLENANASLTQLSTRSIQTRSSSFSSSDRQSPDGAVDLEKASRLEAPLGSRIYASGNAPVSQITTRSSARISRIQSLTNRKSRAGQFEHPLSHVKTSRDVLVDFDGPDDPYHPFNWPLRKKVVTTMLYGLTTAGATFASSVYSPAVRPISIEYGIGEEVSLLGISFLLVGFGLGPLIWAPLSEVYGRKPSVLLPYLVGAIMSFGTGAGKDIQTILITRFFTGFFSSAPVTNTGGCLADMYRPTQRGTALVFYALAVTGGPVFGPIVGGAFINGGVSWRWTEYVTGIFMLTILFFDFLILDETYAPVLLVYKARRLRISTQNWALHARHEEWDVSAKELAIKFGVRPFQMLMTPICFLVALYASFVYGCLYAQLIAFNAEFSGERGWNPLIGSLPFLAFLVGVLIAGVVNIVNQQLYNKRLTANDGQPVPEARLLPMMVGSFIFAGGLFFFAWTSSASIHWVCPVIAIVLVGFGFFTIFQSALNYLIDTFQRFAASAIAANTFLRSVCACAFPLFIDPMFSSIGIGWGMSVFGFFAVLLIPVPFLFYIWGPSIRKRGKYTSNMG